MHKKLTNAKFNYFKFGTTGNRCPPSQTASILMERESDGFDSAMSVVRTSKKKKSVKKLHKKIMQINQ